MTEDRRIRSVYAVIILFCLLTGDAVRYTIGWWAWGALMLVLTAVAVVFLVRYRSRWRIGQLPYPLLAFLVLAAASIAWSFYPGASALGTATTVATAIAALTIAILYSWEEILATLTLAVRLVLGLSILFELYVSLIIRGPILPLVPSPGIDYATLDKIPLMLYWSRNELFQVLDGGKIQGITGNSVLLAFVALVGVIVFSLQLARRRRVRDGAWLALAIATLLMTRSATITAALVAVVIVAAAVLAIRRAQTGRALAVTYGVIVGVVAAAIAAALVFQAQLLALLGKSEDLTGRLDIWATVIDLAQQRPVFGWGWVSYWVPWVAPFDDLVFRNGVRQLHAHNAWIDVWFQLGIIGLVVFGALVVSTVARSWSLAVDRPLEAPHRSSRYTATSLLPLLVLVGLLVQSLAESRLLVEFGMLFLMMSAIKTKRGESTGAPL